MTTPTEIRTETRSRRLNDDPNTPHKRYLQTRYFASLDGLRCLCILAVLWHHSTKPDIPLRLNELGFLGVGMFFALSGFLITTLLLRERDSTGTISLTDFYARRTIRIFPIYYLLLAALAVFYGLVNRGTAEGQAYFQDLPYFLTYTSNWIHVAAGNQDILWSLATEEQFYILWPLIEKLLRPRWALGVLLGIIGVNQLINFGITDPLTARWFGEEFNSLSIMDATFTPIALGVLLAHCFHHPGVFKLFYRVLAPAWSPLALLLGFLVFLEFTPRDISGWPRLGIHLLMTMLLGSIVIREQHWLRRPLMLWPFKRLGMISYGMYLYHMWCLHIVREGLTAAGVVGEERLYIFPVAGLLLTIAVSEASFRLIETPILKLKKRFATGRNATKPLSTPNENPS
ncbi:MAG: acyltransferase [Planctomycetota bacterium]